MTRARSLALATARHLPDGIPDDQALLAAFRDVGVDARHVVWDDPGVDWTAFDGVLVRTTWDYWEKQDAFLAWADARAAEGTPLWNGADVIRWNHDKRYLRELAAKGVAVAPTRWVEPGERVDLAALMDREGWSEVVVKPAVSAGAVDTWRVPREEAEKRQGDVDVLTARGAVLVQPFLDAFLTEGEYSFIFFGGTFSHATLKRPKQGDFRVQPQHGGTTVPVQAPDADLAVARTVLDAVDADLAYARVDCVRVDGALHLVELEVIEPNLFLHTDADAAGRLARAIVERL